MPLLKGGKITDDPWETVADDDDLPLNGHVIISMDRWISERDSLIGHNSPLGLRLKSDQRPDDISDDLDRFGVVVLEFPTFKDGRAFSQARRLRDRFKYRGEVRATGKVLRDQWAFMGRCGIDALEVEIADAETTWVCAEKEVSVFYQPGADRRPSVLALRHSD
ncbi:MAG: DUF934 domain-containing protein [Rhodospirillales bacterium]|nr:DUF934 domain-containing protein [Rhodospirillales bacterium]